MSKLIVLTAGRLKVLLFLVIYSSIRPIVIMVRRLHLRKRLLLARNPFAAHKNLFEVKQTTPSFNLTID